MRRFIGKAIIIAAALGMAAPQLATARQHHRSSYGAQRHYQSCRNARHRRAANGTMIGGASGALAGGLIGHSVTGAVLGGVGGALIGHAVSDHSRGNC
jgi:YMGG-like Gly-zipper